jgi:spermidine/putrescine-binding protein
MRKTSTSGFGSPHSRRDILRQMSLGVAAAGMPLGATRHAFAQSETLDVLMGPSAVLPALLEMFHKQTGIKVQPAPYVSPTDVMTKLFVPGGGSRFDVVATLTDFTRPAMGEAVGKELILPWTEAEVPNSRHVMPLFKDDLLTKGGKSYTLPFYWGYDSVVYNRDHVKDDDAVTQSWGILFDDRYKGKVALRDDAHQSLLVTALFLGNKDPLAMERSDLKQCVDFLISKKRNFRTLWSKFAEAVGLMASGEVVAMYGWILLRTTLQNQGMNVTNNWPREGLLWWGQAAMIPKEARNPKAAFRFMDFLLSREYGEQLTKLNGGILSASTLAQQAFSEEERRKLGYDIMQRNLNLFRLGLPKRLDLWNEAWAEFKSA